MSSPKLTPSIVPEQLYTSEEVAELLRVSLRTVQRLLQAGSLKSFKIHGQYRIKGLDLLGYLDGVRHDSESRALAESHRPADLLESLSLAPVALEVSPLWGAFISQAESLPESKTGFLQALQDLRGRISQELGFVLPGVRIQDQAHLQGPQYQILIHGQIVAQGELVPEGNYGLATLSVNGLSSPQNKPLERLSETYLPTEKSADSLRGSEVLLRHLDGIVRAFAHEILAREDVFVMSESLRKSHPVVLEEILHLDGPVPGKLTIGQLTRILRQLLEEKVSIRPLALICESLADGLDQGLSGAALYEKVRQGLARPICAGLADSQGVIRVLSLAASSETALRQAFASGGPELHRLARALQEALLREVQKSRVLLCPEDLRRPVYEVLARNFSAWQVISHAEIDRLFWLSAVAELEL